MVFTAQDTALIGLAGVIVGGIFGNRYAIDRDRRNEWNTLISPIRITLLRIKNGGVLAPLPPDWTITVLLIRERLCCLRRRAFDSAIESYKQNKDTYHRNRKPDGMGGFMDGDTTAEDRAAISHVANDLLGFLKQR